MPLVPLVSGNLEAFSGPFLEKIVKEGNFLLGFIMFHTNGKVVTLKSVGWLLLHIVAD
jgi:hypothetical protein